MRSLVNIDGPVETAFVRGTCICGDTDDRRIDVFVGELKRFKIEVTSLQETRLFGQATYSVGDSIVLLSGRSLPLDGAPLLHGKGVAIVLRGSALRAWKDGGS